MAKMLQDACLENREKAVIAVVFPKIAGVLPNAQTVRAMAWEPNIPRKLVLIAALCGGGDPNETIYPSRLHRRGACSVGDGCIRDAARSRKRAFQRRQRRRRAGEGRTWPRPRS